MKKVPLKMVVVALFLIFAITGCTVQPAPAPAAKPASPSIPTPGSPTDNQTEDAFAEARKRMVVEQLQRRGIIDLEVLKAMAKVPRHQFVPREYLSEAYADYPLPIGHGQTISQPFIVALMTQHLLLQSEEKVLEIGTGSGYQAAILAELTDEVYSVEIIEPLGQQAAAILKKLGYEVHGKIDDGYYGWPEFAPFDTIIVTCAPDHVPRPLIKQLKDGGRLVIPIGPPGFYQTLWLFERKGEEVRATNLVGVRFVPMLGEH